MSSTAPFKPRPAEGLKHPSVAALLRRRVTQTPDATALRFKQDGAWRSVTWAEAWDRSASIARALVARGYEPGQRVALMASTSEAWILVDFALTLAGIVSVPIYPTVTADEARYILDDSDARAVFVDDDAMARGLEQPRPVFVLDPSTQHESLSALSADAPGADDDDLPGLHRTLDDVFSLVYTSGTTGVPKGVIITHKNLVYESWAIKNTIAVDGTDEQLLILPLAHIFARHMVWAAVESGAITAVAESPERIASNLIEIEPTFVGAAPRFFEKVYARVMNSRARKGMAARRAFDWALELGARVAALKRAKRTVPRSLRAQLRVANRAGLAEIRALFGRRIRFFVSGAAPLAPSLAEFFHAADLLVLEGYGLTETTGATHVNRPDRYRFGTVGPALPGCEVSLGEGGEILIRGHNVMRGYWKDDALTAEKLTPEGWLRTGDLGSLDGAFLRVTGRSKDVIITAGGKNVSPQKIERLLGRRAGIERAIVFGDQCPFLVALITLDADVMMEIADREGLGCRSYAELARHPRLKALVAGHVEACNERLASYETIKRFALLPEPLSQAKGELTPTGKVRRTAVGARYRQQLDELYAGTGAEPGREAAALLAGSRIPT